MNPDAAKIAHHARSAERTFSLWLMPLLLLAVVAFFLVRGALNDQPPLDEGGSSQEIASEQLAPEIGADESPASETVAMGSDADEAAQTQPPDHYGPLTVFGNGVVIAYGDDSPSQHDHSDFGSIRQGSDPALVIRTFTLHNAGTTPLTLRTIHLPEGFVLVTRPGSTLGAGRSTTFQVRPDITSQGLQDGEIRIDHSDTPHSPFVFTIRAEIVPPWPPSLEVLGNQTQIVAGNPTANYGDHTDFGSISQNGSAVRTFTIRNAGDLLLTLSEVQLPEGFILASEPTTTVEAGGSTTFQVQLDTATQGTRRGTIHIFSNDDSANPFSFEMQGFVTQPAPGIAVLGNGMPIAFGAEPLLADYTDFGTIVQGSEPILRTFTVRNDGGLPLAVGGIEVPAGFSLVAAPEGVVMPGESTEFQLRLDTAVVGVVHGEARIDNDDPNQTPFIFTIQGVVAPLVPAIVVIDEGRLLPIGGSTPNAYDHVHFGGAIHGSAPIVRGFSIRNDGAAPLRLGEIELPPGFALATLPTSPVAPGETTRFEIRLETDVAGTPTGQVRIANNDANTDPFAFSVEGVVIAVQPPSIIVTGSGRSIAHGQARPSLENHTDFGSFPQQADALELDVMLGQTTRTFTITNAGHLPLVIESLSVPEGFTLDTEPFWMIGSGAHTSFRVRLDTAVQGVWSGEIRIQSNHENRDAFVFWIQGSVTEPPAPRINVYGNDRNIVNRNDDPSLDDHTDFGRVTRGGQPTVRTFVIRNTGGQTLNLGAVEVPQGFTLITSPAATLDPGGITSLQIRLDTANVGMHAGAVTFAHNALNLDPFFFTIRGEVLDLGNLELRESIGD